jgi:DNA helicase-2/ATP-dependent DNA helicase PcrA
VTFTNKAAKEMRERVFCLLGREERDLWVSTFHSACVRILRGHAHLLGYPREFVIYDDRDQVNLIESILKELHWAPQGITPRWILARIRAAKQAFVPPEEYLKWRWDDPLEERMKEIYTLYQQRLRRSGAMDFDDLLFNVMRLFVEHEEVLDLYGRRWVHILVDEFQDTNEIQYRIVKALSRYHNNLCVVGDDDQSIYSWRGATLENMLAFERDFPDAKVIRLEQNYRSTKIILRASGGVIERNLLRRPKELWTTNEEGEEAVVFQAMDDRHEARYVVERIGQLVREKGYRYSHVAVFYRTHAQSRVLEEELVAAGVPFSVFGGVGFYERKEIKDVIAYMRALYNPNDEVSWKRIINTPPRGIGKATLSAVDKIASQRGLSFREALDLFCRESPKGAPARRIREFLELMDRLSEAGSRGKISSLVEKVLNETGYMEYLKRDEENTAQSRIENVEELLNLVAEFQLECPDGGLGDFLEQVSLISDVDRLDVSQDRVNLMTIHAAKGLEFPVVFIVGLEEGLFPHQLSMESEEALEEERRIFYVGMTRAMKELYLSCSASRRSRGWLQSMRPSRFLTEIPQDCMVPADYGEAEGEEPVKAPRMGQWVRHPAFGVGSVIRFEENDTRVVVYFPGHGERRFLIASAPLQWL